MSAEFNVWLLIVGVVAGGAMTWLVLADSNRRERELDARELPAEATWIARMLGQPLVDAEVAEQVLRAHRLYLGFTPPDALVPADELEVAAEISPGSGLETPAASTARPDPAGEQGRP